MASAKLVFLVVICVIYVSEESYAQSGARVRMSKKGLEYAARVVVQKLKDDVMKQRLKDQSGSKKRLSWSVRNIKITYFSIARYALVPVPGTGLKVSLNGVSLSLSGDVRYSYKRGWFRIRDRTSLKVKTRGLNVVITLRIGASNGRPTISTSHCAARVGSLDMDFSGGAAWIYNMFSGLFEGKLKSMLQEMLCKESRKLIRTKAETTLATFSVAKNIDKWAIINYEFQKPVATSNYFDLLLKGEFQKRSNPGSSGLAPPTMDVTSAADKMLYIWLSDYTINTAGKVYHEAGFLNRVVKSTDKLIPPDIRPYLNTNSFTKIVPMLAIKFPNRPIQFRVGSYRPPIVKIRGNPGYIKLMLYFRLTVEVIKKDGSIAKAFFAQLDIDAGGFVSVNTNNTISGRIVDFRFSAKIGGSILGGFTLPVDNPSVATMVKGLIIDPGNAALQQGFPLPNVKGITLKNPRVALVKNAIRIDTDVRATL